MYKFSAFRTFVRFVLVWICRFPLLLGVWEELRFVIVALPGLFSYLFFLLLLSKVGGEKRPSENFRKWSYQKVHADSGNA